MSVLSSILMTAGIVLLSFAAWSVQQLTNKASGTADKTNIYLSCAGAFTLILIGQLSGIKMSPAIVSDRLKEPSYLERGAHHEFKVFSGRQGHYHKRAQAAAMRATGNTK